MDDAGGGRRGLRAQRPAKLLDALERGYGIRPAGTRFDLGGSSNLNLLVVHGGRKLVARIYRPSVSTARLSDIQRVRRQLAARGFPCPVPVAASDGTDSTAFDGRLLEVEEYVEQDGQMDTWDRVEAGLRVLGRIHGILDSIATSADHKEPRFVNHIHPENLLEATARGAARIRSWSPTAEEARLADAAEELARIVTDAQQNSRPGSLPRQLVHGTSGTTTCCTAGTRSSSSTTSTTWASERVSRTSL